MADGEHKGAGARLAAWWAGLRGVAYDADGKRLIKPYVRRNRGYTSLQFTRRQTQSRMLAEEPDRLLIDYTRTMMGVLLLRPDPARIGMIGLGGGSQAKFCHRHLARARVEAVENNPHVVALRRRFGIPDDDARLRVVVDDGAAFVRRQRGRYDVLLVDGYDETGIPAMLSTQRFYDDCRDALADGGAMSVNLFSTDADMHLERIRRSFGDARVLVLGEAKMSNRVAFAWSGGGRAGPAVDAAHASSLLPEAARDQLAPVFERVAQALHPASGVADTRWTVR